MYDENKTIRLIGLVDGSPHRSSGQYIVLYDPDYHLPDGSYDGGALACTPDLQEASRFTMAEAVALFRSGPSCPCHRLRPDGRPNRPLTAFTVVIS
jgi:hypothetical protein